MTKLLILSDSHGSTQAVRRILAAEKDAGAVIFWATASTIWSWP